MLRSLKAELSEGWSSPNLTPLLITDTGIREELHDTPASFRCLPLVGGTQGTSLGAGSQTQHTPTLHVKWEVLTH